MQGFTHKYIYDFEAKEISDEFLRSGEVLSYFFDASRCMSLELLLQMQTDQLIQIYSIESLFIKIIRKWFNLYESGKRIGAFDYNDIWVIKSGSDYDIYFSTLHVDYVKCLLYPEEFKVMITNMMHRESVNIDLTNVHQSKHCPIEKDQFQIIYLDKFEQFLSDTHKIQNNEFSKIDYLDTRLKNLVTEAWMRGIDYGLQLQMVQQIESHFMEYYRVLKSYPLDWDKITLNLYTSLRKQQLFNCSSEQIQVNLAQFYDRLHEEIRAIYQNRERRSVYEYLVQRASKGVNLVLDFEDLLNSYGAIANERVMEKLQGEVFQGEKSVLEAVRRAIDEDTLLEEVLSQVDVEELRARVTEDAGNAPALKNWLYAISLSDDSHWQQYLVKQHINSIEQINTLFTQWQVDQIYSKHEARYLPIQQSITNTQIKQQFIQLFIFTIQELHQNQNKNIDQLLNSLLDRAQEIVQITDIEQAQQMLVDLQNDICNNSR